MCALATSRLPLGRLRTSLRVPHIVDVAKKPVFCHARCCTSTEHKGSLCSKGFIIEAQHRRVGASFLLPVAICCQRKLGDGTCSLQAGNALKRDTWPQLLKNLMKNETVQENKMSFISPVPPLLSAWFFSLWQSDLGGGYSFHQPFKEQLNCWTMLMITLSHTG